MALVLARPKGGSTPTIKEIPVGTIDGHNDTFQTTQNYFPTTLSVFRNGLREAYVLELGNKNFRFETAPRVGTKLFVEYDRF